MGLGALLKGGEPAQCSPGWGEPAQCSPGWTSRGTWNHLVKIDSHLQSPVPLTREITRLNHLICLPGTHRLCRQSGGVNCVYVSCALALPTGKQPSTS